MSHLLLTLGHGSSAILVDEGEIKIGYETERLTHKKSDSAFPELAIMEISKWYPIEEITEIFITHWFIDPEKDLKDQGKWYDEVFMEKVFGSVPITTLSREFTHHDAHANSVWCFNGTNMSDEETHTFVIDGFGSYGETVSIYNPDSSLAFRAYGFSRSLGLFYQYATSFLDMKENQDEYKLLGYESHIKDMWANLIAPDDVLDLAHVSAAKFYNRIQAGGLDVAFDPLLSLDALVATKKLFRDEFENVLKLLRIENEPRDSLLVRTVIAFYVQSVVEEVVLKLLHVHEVKNVFLAGGVFMNVKLNNAIANFLPGKTCIMPLCGDQGACIGLYAANRGLKWPGYLTWGRRSLCNIKHLPNIVINEDAGFVVDLISRNFIVNIVRGDMEFGARALGNTSTLALPTVRMWNISINSMAVQPLCLWLRWLWKSMQLSSSSMGMT